MCEPSISPPCVQAPYNAAIAHVAAMIVNASSIKTGYGNFVNASSIKTGYGNSASHPASNPPLSERAMSSPRRRNRPRRRGRPSDAALTALREGVGERTARPPHTMSEQLGVASSATALADLPVADLVVDSAADFRWPTEIGSRSGAYKYTDLAAAPLAVCEATPHVHMHALALG